MKYQKDLQEAFDRWNKLTSKLTEKDNDMILLLSDAAEDLHDAYDHVVAYDHALAYAINKIIDSRLGKGDKR